MTDLAVWLLEQIAEDDRQVRGPGRPSILGLPRRWYGRVWLPHRVRDECDVKRRIIRMADPTVRTHKLCDRCQTCVTVRLLALPYADRPGYREEWKP